eukprot:TRINITY_DN19742_c0_g1_i1.p1 TRINITY_DN19742_c0_g1~~TRINITY_DN19742_c0_g1_i1.p1  ORF type:complete len:358 (+),score=122.89 TRINITY_DN19742_c0_g1_i1:49-1122(+)
MGTMKAVVLQEGENSAHEFAPVGNRPVPVLASGKREVLVKIHAAALNHRDNWMTMGMYPMIQFGKVLGSDGCGVVKAVGDMAADARWLGQRVVIDPSIGWGESIERPDKRFNILGMPVDGTLAEYIKVPTANIYPAPQHLTDAQAAALPLAGGTAYRALVTKGRAKKGDAVLVTGIGGGVALFALQLAVALGCHVYVTSSSPEKLARAKGLGAVHGVNYKQKGWEKELKKHVLKHHGGFDCVVDGAGGPGLNQYLKMMKQGGRVVSYGVTAGPPKQLVLPNLFLKNVDLCGTAMCAPQEFAALLRLVTEHRILPVVDSRFPFADARAALQRMKDGAQFGKIVVTLVESDAAPVGSKL